MTKSRFMEKQPSVKVIEKDKVYVYICLNEKEVTEDHINRWCILLIIITWS